MWARIWGNYNPQTLRVGMDNASEPLWQFPPRCLLQRNEDVHPYGDSYNSAHSSFICNIPQLEAAQVRGLTVL